MRITTAYLIAPIMRLTGFRFSTDYRHGATRYHRVIYAMVSTVRANTIADSLR